MARPMAGIVRVGLANIATRVSEIRHDGRAAIARTWLTSASAALAAALAFQLPAELIHPLLRVGPIGISNVEATGYLLLAAWGGAVAMGGLPIPRIPRWALVLLAIVVAGAFLSAALAAFDRPAAIKAAMRFVGALAVGLAAAHVTLTSPSRGRVVAAAGLAGATLSAALGIVEFVFGWQHLGSIFGQFREAPVSLGGFATRATGSLLHPNLAAWYWGSCAVAALATAAASRPALRLPLIGAAGMLMLATTLTMSRGGLLGVVVASIAATAIVTRSGRVPLWRALPMVVLPLPVITLIASLASPLVATRLISETDIEWYRFSIEAPEDIRSANGEETIRVSVTNRGPIEWPTDGTGRVLLSYHVRRVDGTYHDYRGELTPLPDAVAPGETVTVEAEVDIAGGLTQAIVDWDLLQAGGSWFSERLPTDLANTGVTIVDPQAGAPPGGVDEAPDEDERQLLESMAFGRGELWTIATEMIVARPLTGIGFDNFRLGYGAWRGLTDWDRTLTSHNTYLEMLVSLGVFAAALAALVITAGVALVRSALANAGPVQLSLFAFLAALAVHGMFDAFVVFSTALYALGAAVMGGLISWERHPIRRRA